MKKKIRLRDDHLKDPKIRLESFNYFNSNLLDTNIPTAPAIPIKTKCTIWTGGKSGKYGSFQLNRKEFKYIFQTEAHIASYMIFKGEVGNKIVLHLCNDTLCVNPDHLVLGDAKENGLHATKNRQNSNPLNRSWKQNTPEVRDIRILYFQHGYPVSVLAEMFNLSPTTIYNDINGKVFKNKPIAEGGRNEVKQSSKPIKSNTRAKKLVRGSKRD